MKKFAGVFAAAAMLTGFAAAPSLAQEEREVVQSEAPEFPRAAQRREIEGHVVVRYNVSPEGTVSDVEVVEATPAGVFERAVMRALENWRYAAAAETTNVEKRFDFAFAD
ncbi:MAG: energy transducer TonB [Oceanicaulis sp.]